MNERNALHRTRRIGTGLAFIVFPLVFVFAFAGHPGLLNPHLLGPEGMILRARHAPFLQFGHALVTLNTALLVVVALHFMRLLDRGSAAWAITPRGLPTFAGGREACLCKRRDRR
ncbi:hypothetical protein ACFL3S_13775 [Gemmatimonadota bacterium]